LGKEAKLRGGNATPRLLPVTEKICILFSAAIPHPDCECGEMQISVATCWQILGKKSADEERVCVYIINETLSFTLWHHVCRYGGGNEEEFLTTAFPRHV
jgi:hypothetical protein